MDSYCISSSQNDLNLSSRDYIVPPREAVCPGAEVPSLGYYTKSKQMVSKAGMQRPSDSSGKKFRQGLSPN